MKLPKRSKNRFTDNGCWFYNTNSWSLLTTLVSKLEVRASALCLPPVCWVYYTLTEAKAMSWFSLGCQICFTWPFLISDPPEENKSTETHVLFYVFIPAALAKQGSGKQLLKQGTKGESHPWELLLTVYFVWVLLNSPSGKSVFKHRCLYYIHWKGELIRYSSISNTVFANSTE